MRTAPLFRDNLSLLLRGALVLLLMLGAYVAFTAVLAFGFGLSVGPLVLLVIIGAAIHLLGSQGRVLRDLGIANQDPLQGSSRVIASDIIRWALPPAFPLFVWLLWIRVPASLPLLLVVAALIFLLEFFVFAVRNYMPEPGPASLSLSQMLEGTPLDALQRVSQMAGQPSPGLWLLDSPAPDAFALGLSPSAGDIVITRGLVDLSLSGEEMEAVMAHELCHLMHHDTTVLLAVEGLGGWPGFVGCALVVIAANRRLVLGLLPRSGTDAGNRRTWLPHRRGHAAGGGDRPRCLAARSPRHSRSNPLSGVCCRQRLSFDHRGSFTTGRGAGKDFSSARSQHSWRPPSSWRGKCADAVRGQAASTCPKASKTPSQQGRPAFRDCFACHGL